MTTIDSNRTIGIVRLLLGSVIVLVCGRASAETSEELRARGEELAKEARFSEAIETFKAAERLEPRARHSCLIALAYLRRELWPQAEIFLEQCEKRATPADPVPEWYPAATEQLGKRIAAANVAAITITVAPSGAAVKLAVSSFAPDERFEPRTIHLPPGRHVLLATAEGFRDTQVVVNVADKTPQTISVTMLPPGEDLEPRKTSPGRRAMTPFFVIGAGGAIVLGAAASHAFYFWPARTALATPQTREEYDRRSVTFDRSRTLTIGLYVTGAVTLGVGLILERTVFARERTPTVAVIPMDGGGVLSLGWQQ